MTDTNPETPKRPVTGKLGASSPVSGTDTVTIAYRGPAGGIVLRAQRWVEDFEQSPNGPRTVRIAKEIPGSRFTVGGWTDLYHLPGNQLDRRFDQHPGGFSLTPGCPRELWENWLSFNADTPLVTEGLIFAVGTMNDATVEAKTRAELRTGLEPVDPDHPEKTVPTRTRNQLGQLSQITSPT